MLIVGIQSVIMLMSLFPIHNAHCVRYAKCRHADCHYGDSRGAALNVLIVFYASNASPNAYTDVDVGE